MTCENKGTYFTHCLWAFSPARVYTNKNVFFPAVFNTFSSYASRLVWFGFLFSLSKTEIAIVWSLLAAVAEKRSWWTEPNRMFSVCRIHTQI